MNNFDVDIDVADRSILLSKIKHIPAMIDRNENCIKHNTGIYVNPIPVDPMAGLASLDYQEAERLGYIKIDILNVNVYEQIKSNEHLEKLMNSEPLWDMLQYEEFVKQVIHINNHFDTMQRMPEPINSIQRMAMLLCIIRPAKRYLIGKPWKEVAAEVWKKPTDGSYVFKKSHSVAYAHLVAIHMNLLCGL